MPDIEYLGSRYAYRDFFASPAMADLRSVAETTRLLVPSLKRYVESRARREDAPENETESAEQVLLRAGNNRPYLRTQLLFLRGAAGLGKTALLRHVTTSQAERFLNGAASFLYLYVDAQGRSLAPLDEAIAALLQDYRARFTYHAVATLTRLGLSSRSSTDSTNFLGSEGTRKPSPPWHDSCPDWMAMVPSSPQPVPRFTSTATSRTSSHGRRVTGWILPPMRCYRLTCDHRASTRP